MILRLRQSPKEGLNPQLVFHSTQNKMKYNTLFFLYLFYLQKNSR